MSQPENKPTKLSDVARQTNSDKAKRFSSTMIPAPPMPKQSSPPVVEPIETPSLPSAAVESDEDVVDSPASALPSDDTQPTTAEVELVPAAKPAPVKPTRTRRSGTLTIEDVIAGEPPKGEQYPRQMRVSEHHHKLLRKLAFTHEVTMNHVLYNLLDLLDQANQRDQQKGD